MQSSDKPRVTPKGRSLALQGSGAAALPTASDNLVRVTNLTSPTMGGDNPKEQHNTMSDTTNTTVGSDQDINDLPANVEARNLVFASILPALVAARDANASTLALNETAGSCIVDARLTYKVMIDGQQYDDLFAVSQSAKNGISAFFKSNGIPVSQEAGASTLRYHATKNAEKRFADSTPGTYGPAGWHCKGGKWTAIPTQEQVNAATDAKQVKAVQGQQDRLIGRALDAKAALNPAAVVSMLNDRLSNLAATWSDLPLKGSDVQALLSALATTQETIDRLTATVSGLSLAEVAA